MAEFVVILSTAASEAEADRIAMALVAEKLAACVQFTAVKSRYVWKDELVKDDEVLLIVKSRAELFEAARARIRTLHAYETPEVVMFPITDGDRDYLAWLEARTERPEPPEA